MKNVVVIEIKIIYGLLVTEYKPTLFVYFCSFISIARTYVLITINLNVFYQQIQRTKKDLLFIYIDSVNLWHLRARYLALEAFEYLVK